jgi:ABC-type sugar transport system substrate-binding protein
MAQQLGVSFEVYDAAVDANKELADVETMIANKFDGIFVYATDPALGPVISKKMKDAGVVALGADTPMTAEDSYYGVPSIYGGYISGKYMMEQMKAKNWDPKETVYLFADLSAFPACTMRLEGYKKALDEFYPDFPKENIVWYDVPYSLEESLKSIQDSITAHPAKNYLYAVACGDQMAAGGARALEAAGYTSDNAMISGQGGGIGPREELKKPGSLYISYTGYLGTCAGRLAINFMVRLLNGEKDLPQNVQQKVVLLTKDTVDQYYPGGVELCTDEDARGLLP